MQVHKNQSGFGILEGLLVVMVVVLIIIGSWGVYRHYHNTDKNTAIPTLSSQKASSTSKTSDSSTATTNTYAAWKTYIDGTYKYSFEYPSGWTLSNNQNVRGVNLLSPSHAVTIVYDNPGTNIGPQHLGGSANVAFTPMSIDKLTSANEALTVVGGYYFNSSAGKYSPGYTILDNSLLNSYPLTIGRATQFPTAYFTVVSASNTYGSLAASPTNSITTATSAETWFNGTDQETAKLILESFKYNP